MINLEDIHIDIENDVFEYLINIKFQDIFIEEFDLLSIFREKEYIFKNNVLFLTQNFYKKYPKLKSIDKLKEFRYFVFNNHKKNSIHKNDLWFLFNIFIYESYHSNSEINSLMMYIYFTLNRTIPIHIDSNDISNIIDHFYNRIENFK